MKKYIALVIVCIILLIAGVWFAVHKGYVQLPHVPVGQPSLTREVKFSGDHTDEIIKQIRGAVVIDQDILKKNLKDLETWLDLAIRYKQAGDLKGAIEIWKYLNEKFPQQSTSAFNLGVIYQQNLKEYDLSERNYLEAIRRNPKFPLNYLGLHELYRYSYKQNTKAAVDSLLQGMKEIPDDANMPIALAAYYRDDKKDYARSIQYIHTAIDVLKRTEGDTKKIQALEGESERLGKLQ